MENLIKKICFVLLLTTFSSVYAGSCWDGNVDDCRVRAAQGNVRAQYNLGFMYSKGLGVLQDYKESVKWWRKASEQGDAGAQFILAFMYSRGLGALQDYKESGKWYRKAAEQGDAKAQYNLALVYFNGQGVLQNYVMAHMYWNIAAVSGHKSAIKGRGIVEKKMTPSQLEKAQDLAREWMSNN